LELAIIEALRGKPSELANNVWHAFYFLRDNFADERFVDPANTNNIVSDDLTYSEKTLIRDAAGRALKASNWNLIVT
jgi:hypothetical protein